MLLQVGIASSHRLLNQYIADSTGVTPTDGNGDIEAERPILEATTPSFKPLDFSKLDNGEPSKLPRSVVLMGLEFRSALDDANTPSSSSLPCTG